MMLLVAAADGQGRRVIHDASNLDKWSPVPTLSVVTVTGNAETYAWPNGSRSAALLAADGSIVINPAVSAAADPDEELRQAIQSATTLDQLKTALVSGLGAARIKGRPK